MIKTMEEIITDVKAVIGEEPTDEGIAILENITDTLSDYHNKLSDTTDWKAKYEENDKKWRKTYTERFNAPVQEKDDYEEPEIEREVTLMTRYDELFK